jgi:hypothetical protein
MTTELITHGLVILALARYATREEISSGWRIWLSLQKAQRGSLVKWAVKLLTCTVCIGQWIAIVWFMIVRGEWFWQFGIEGWTLAVAVNAVSMLLNGFVEVAAAAVKMLSTRQQLEAKQLKIINERES